MAEYPVNLSTGTITIQRSGVLPNTSNPVSLNLIQSRFDNTIGVTQEYLARVVTYLEDLREVIDNHSPMTSTSFVSSQDPIDFNIPLVPIGTKPVIDPNDLEDFPDEEYNVPTFTDLPIVVPAEALPPEAPEEINPDVVFTELTYASDIYATLLARLLQDLAAGASGLDPTVEVALFARSEAKQQANRDALYQKINAEFSGRHFMLPSGMYLSALNSANKKILSEQTEAENAVLIQSSDLAQKNSQFIVEQSIALEQLIRQAHEGKNNRALDLAKAKAVGIVQTYLATIQAYIADATAKREYVQIQVENLKAVVESNKAKQALYTSQYEGLKVRGDVVANKNKSIVDIYQAEVQGFSEEERAKASNNVVLVEKLKARITYDDFAMRSYIEGLRVELEDYLGKTKIQESVAKELAMICAQIVASAFGAINANVGLSHQTSDSLSESTQHSDSISSSRVDDVIPGA